MIPQDIVARTIYGAARHRGLACMAAVANCIANRYEKPSLYGDGWIIVCTRPRAFDCWHPASDTRLAMERVTEDDPAFREALMLARETVNGDLPDRTHGCTHFERTNPTVKRSHGIEIAGLTFFKVDPTP